MPGLTGQNHSSLSSYAAPSAPYSNQEDESLGAEDIFSMCSLMCFIPWTSFLVIPQTSSIEENCGGGDAVQQQQEFENIAQTEHDKVETTKLPNDDDIATYQSVPVWKQKYIARKSNLELSNSSSIHCAAPKRSSLEETLDRCRNIDNTSDVYGDNTQDDNNTEGVTSATGWSMATFFSYPSLYAKIVGGTGDTDTDSVLDAPDTHEDSSLSLSSVSLSSASKGSYDSLSPVHRGGKNHRRQHSPSGVMDFVE
jgi:hypothetical protein